MIKKPKGFSVYHKDQKDHVNQTFIVLIPLVLSLIGWWLSDAWFQSLSIVFRSSCMLSFLVFMFFSVYRFFQMEKMNGNLKGKLYLQEDKIIAVNEDILLNTATIKKLIFAVDDYYKMPINWTLQLEPLKSNGVKNGIEIQFTDGSIRVIRFFQQKKNEFVTEYKEQLINYYEQGFISFLHLIETLGIDKYEDIQAFKKELKELS